MPLNCERCGAETRSVTIPTEGPYKGDFLCKPCDKDVRLDGVNMDRPTPFRDEIPGGIELENYGAKPMTFYSHSERRAYMEKAGLREKEKFAPFPGTDKDPAGI